MLLLVFLVFAILTLFTHIAASQSHHIFNPSRPTSLTALVKLFSDTLDLTSAQRTEAQDPDELLRSIDFEEQGAGYQAAYSKLAASETIVEDPVASVGDSKEFVARQLGAAVGKDARIRGLVGMADAEIVGPFMQSLSGGV